MFYIQIIHIFCKVHHVLKHNEYVKKFKDSKVILNVQNSLFEIFSCSTCVDYAPSFNNSYSYFHLSRY